MGTPLALYFPPGPLQCGENASRFIRGPVVHSEWWMKQRLPAMEARRGRYGRQSPQWPSARHCGSPLHVSCRKTIHPEAQELPRSNGHLPRDPIQSSGPLPHHNIPSTGIFRSARSFGNVSAPNGAATGEASSAPAPAASSPASSPAPSRSPHPPALPSPCLREARPART